KGDGTLTASQTVGTAGTYTFTAPTLADATYQTTATFTPTAAAAVSAKVTVTIDTTAPTLLGGTGTEQAPLFTRTLTFSKSIDTSTISTASILVSGPGISGSVHPAQVLGSGTTYTVSFASPLLAAGTYTLQLGPTVADLAGNTLGPGVTDTF